MEFHIFNNNFLIKDITYLKKKKKRERERERERDQSSWLVLVEIVLP